MSEIITTTGKAVSNTPFERARLLTERIKAKSRELWQDLKTMRDEELYRELGYTTIEEWGEGELGWTSRYVRYQIKASEIIGLIESSNRNNCSALPTHEGQVRPLARLENHAEYNDGELIVDAWQEACHLAGDKPPTEKDVRYVVDELMYVEPPPLPEGEYNVIYADPPWMYDNQIEQWGPTSLHYRGMRTTDIINKINEVNVSRNAVLFLWVTNPMLKDGIFVVEETGFEYKTNIAWVKTELAKPGSGFYVRGRHELLFIATKGNFTPLDKNIAPPIGSIITAPVREHSRKPDEAVAIIERLYPGCTYLDMWARTEREGWEVWGDEVGKY